MKILSSLLLIIFALPAFACFNISGKLGVDGETYKIDQKVDLGKDYSVPMGSFIFGFKVLTHEKEKNKFLFVYKLQERKAKSLETVTQGEEEIDQVRSHEIFAKGEEKQPNSIITIKLKDI